MPQNMGPLAVSDKVEKILGKIFKSCNKKWKKKEEKY